MPMHVFTDGSNKYCLPVSPKEVSSLTRTPRRRQESRRYGLFAPVDVGLR